MTIGIDIDEVLAYSLQCEIDWHNHTYSTALKREDFITMDYWKVWGGTREEAIDKILTYLQSEFFDRIQPVPGAVEGVDILSKIERLVIITGRHSSIKSQTEKWLDAYFPGKFSEIYFTRNSYLEGCRRWEKSDLCKKAGASDLIEDSPRFAAECAANGIRVLLYHHLWNQSLPETENIKRVYGWLGEEGKPGVIHMF